MGYWHTSGYFSIKSLEMSICSKVSLQTRYINSETCHDTNVTYLTRQDASVKSSFSTSGGQPMYTDLNGGNLSREHMSSILLSPKEPSYFPLSEPRDVDVSWYFRSQVDGSGVVGIRLADQIREVCKIY